MSTLTYACIQASALARPPEGDMLLLPAYAKNAPVSGAGRFLLGQLRDSWLAASRLITLAKVVASQFVPQSAALRDPIVTAGAGQLRFESFSSCSGVCTDLYLGPAALDGEFMQAGTTHVDFNEPMVNALSRIACAEPLAISPSAR